MTYKVFFILAAFATLTGAYNMTWKVREGILGPIRYREAHFGWVCFFLALVFAAAGWICYP